MKRTNEMFINGGKAKYIYASEVDGVFFIDNMLCTKEQLDHLRTLGAIADFNPEDGKPVYGSTAE